MCVWSRAGSRVLPLGHFPPLRPLPPSTQADKTQRKAGLADRLINGLSGENARWGAEIKRMEAVEGKLVGDVLMASAFVSYAAPFNMLFRQSLLTEKWIPDLIERAIPMSQVRVSATSG